VNIDCLSHSLARPLLASGCLAFITAAGLGSFERPIFPDCLNAASAANSFRPTEHNVDCNKDALNLWNDRSVREGAKLLGINAEEVRLFGCMPAPFRTVPALGSSNQKFSIYYPTGVQLGQGGYIAPLLHEMGHVFQLKLVGSYQKLQASHDNSIERIELGADFIAGYAAGHLDLEPKAFLVNLSLIGSYNGKDLDYHGRPEDRAAAFRNGYFYMERQSTLTDSYADFQDNRFAQIKNH